LSSLLVEALIARPVFAEAGEVLHGDPHAGNLFLTEEHRLGILDWSLVGSLGERERVARCRPRSRG
jgi:predicted unusual protein kinase regulating ubiquinone biosynthesis (AarF/ABC1/UbiB family)